MNAGKKFEQNFKNSIPKSVYYYRFRDGTASWGNQENTRFQATNLCDCLLYNRGQLHLLELKSYKSKALPFTAIRKNQIDGLLEASQFGINAGFVIKLNGETYYIDVESVDEFIKNSDRKSIPLKWLEENGIYIPRTKLKVNYRYDIGVML